jgi:mono/diheme cytochrome c family protein
MIVALLLLAQAATPEIPLAEQGAELFALRCSVPFCHGPDGTSGRAPALAGRNFEPAELRRAIADGIPSRGMPPFQQQLGEEGVNAVLAYVRSLAGRAPAPPPPTNGVKATVKLTKEAAEGRELFFDSSRLPGCGTCHAVGDMGGKVAGKLGAIDSVNSLRSIRTAHVRTARVPNEPNFPAIIAEVTPDMMRVFDLSAPLPVLRSFPKAEITLDEATAWDHYAVVKRYSPEELQRILLYIRSVRPPSHKLE